jgi:hypothetical protein
MTARRRTWATRALAASAATALALLPVAATASDFPLEPRESENSVAQSVQIRMNADGTPNGSAVNFRWSVTQLTAQGEPNTDITVKVPEQGLMLHNLQRFGTIPQEGDQGVFTIGLDGNGFGTARSVSLYPPSMDDIPVDLKAEFTLNGEPITAEDLVGKDGVVTATYTVTNRTRQTLTVPITSVTGDEVEKEVEADVPLVVEAATYLPQAWGGLNTGSGLGGADGRGNWQVKWIALPFSPLSEDGTASFGWAANVTDAVIPAMLVQVLPIYIPEGEEGGDTATTDDVVSAGEKLGVPPPDVSGEVDSIKSGVADVISGLEALTADDGGEDPLTVVEGKVNDFFTEFGTNIETISSLVDPNNPEGATALVQELQATVASASQTIADIEQSGVLDAIDQAASILTPENAQLLTDLAEPINKLADNADIIEQLAGTAEEIQLIADNAKLIATGVTTGCIDPPGATEPVLPPEVCDNKDAIIAVLESEELQIAAKILNDPKFQQAAQLIASDEFARAAAALEKAAPVLVPMADALQVLSKQLPGVITTLEPVLSALDKVLAQLEAALTSLSEQLAIIGQGLAEKNVDLPTLDAVLAEITAQILASEGGQQVTSGMDQINGGIAGVKSEIGAYVAELSVALQAAKAQVDEAVAEGKEAAGAVIDKADTLKAEVAGLVTAAHESPLPYGGDPADAPEGTKLAGAYEFRLDPADTEAPSTIWRLLLAIVLLVAGGFVGNWALSRRPAAAGAAAASASPPGRVDAEAAADAAATATVAMAAAPGEGLPAPAQQPGTGTGPAAEPLGGEPAVGEPAEEPAPGSADEPTEDGEPGGPQPG